MKLKTLPFDPGKYVDDDAAVAAYLRDIARARGMAQIAQASGINREALYKALGVRLFAQPL